MARSKQYNITKSNLRETERETERETDNSSVKVPDNKFRNLDIKNLSLGKNVIPVQKGNLQIENIPSKIIDRNFGEEEDYIEVHIFDDSNNIINRITDFKDYNIIENNTLSIDPNSILLDLGYTAGKFNVRLHLFRNKVFNTQPEEYPFSITEISPKRREIKSISTQVENNLFSPAVSQFIAEINSSAYFKEFSLIFSDGAIVPAINIKLNKSPEKYELILKTLNLLPSTTNDFKIVEEIVDPIGMEIDLGFPTFEEDLIELRGPNFEINTRQESSIPSEFKNFDNLLDYNFTSSYQYLLNNLENPETLNIQYDYIRPVSESSYEESYHFESFVHFGSATEKLKNFKYKLELIEEYDSKVKKNK